MNTNKNKAYALAATTRCGMEMDPAAQWQICRIFEEDIRCAATESDRMIERCRYARFLIHCLRHTADCDSDYSRGLTEVAIFELESALADYRRMRRRQRLVLERWYDDACEMLCYCTSGRCDE